MMNHASAMMTLLLLACLGVALGVPAATTGRVQDNEIIPDDGDGGARGLADEDPAWRLAGRVLDSCGDRDLVPCVGAKVVAALGRASRAAVLPLAPGVSLVRSGDNGGEEEGAAARAATEAEVHNALDAAGADGQAGTLADMLLQAAARFFRSHVLQVRLPESAAQPLKRAFEEGRGKKKILRTLMPLIMGLGLKMMALVPLGLGVVGLLAAKALLIGKVALILAGVLAAQKLLGSSGGGGGGLAGLGSGWSSGGSSGAWSSSPPAGAGWSATAPGSSSYYRSFGDAAADELAYKAHAPNNS